MAQVADYVPDWQGEHHCLIMDDEHWWDSDGEKLAMQQHQKEIKQFCAGRSPAFYNDQTHNARLLHFRSHSKDNRLLVHFYAFVYFTNPMVGNYYKRMVRDRVRYANEIFCAGGKIIKSLLEEAGKNDNNGGSARYGAGGDLSPFGGYSSMHIRRGKYLENRCVTVSCDSIDAISCHSLVKHVDFPCNNDTLVLGLYWYNLQVTFNGQK